VTFGIKGGANYSTLIRNGGYLSSEYRLGYVAGPFVRFNISNFYIQPEVLFSSKNTIIRSSAATDINNPSEPVNVRTTVQLNSIDVPLLLGTKLVKTDQFNLRVMAGPLASIILESKGLNELFTSETPVRDAYSKSVWGFQAGIGADLGSITLDAIYEGSFNHSYDLTRYNLGKPKAGLFQFTVGFKFL
jgi:hypothetical protein